MKVDYKVEFLDMYGDVIFTDTIRQVEETSDVNEIVALITPRDRAIEDYRLIKLNNMNITEINKTIQDSIVKDTKTGYIPKNVGHSGMGGGVILKNNQYVEHTSILNKVNQN